MSNLKKYKQVFVESFELEDESSLDALEYNQIAEWDSIGHMTMVAEIEEAFDITLEADDILNFGSFKKGFEILSKYDVQL